MAVHYENKNDNPLYNRGGVYEFNPNDFDWTAGIKAGLWTTGLTALLLASVLVYFFVTF